MLISSAAFIFFTLIVSLSSGLELNCNFIDHSYVWGEIEHTCEVKKLKVEEANETITNVIGDNPAGKTIDGVHQLFADEQTIFYLPNGIAKSFPNLKSLIVQDCSVGSVVRSNFEELRSLTALLLPYNQIEQVPEDAFDDLVKLEFLSLALNKIETLNENVFRSLKSLKRLHLYENQLERIESRIFASNHNLEVIWLQGNKLKFIAADFLTPINNVSEVFLGSNVCIHSWFPGPVTLEGLIREIADRCAMPKEKSDDVGANF